MLVCASIARFALHRAHCTAPALRRTMEHRRRGRVLASDLCEGAFEMRFHLSGVAEPFWIR